ncbi:MAG: hypothetical protein R2822_31450 [Spirosomataceae bacterium]
MKKIDFTKLFGCFLVAFTIVLMASLPATLQDKADGTLAYKGKSKTFNMAIKYVYLVEGPDTFTPSERNLRLLFSAKDISKEIKAATMLRHTDSALTDGEGFQIDLVKGPRYHYWMVLNGGLVQYSGTIPLENFVTSVKTPTHVAGTFKQDNAGAGGPTIDVTFDATLLKKFDK